MTGKKLRLERESLSALDLAELESVGGGTGTLCIRNTEVCASKGGPCKITTTIICTVERGDMQ